MPHKKTSLWRVFDGQGFKLTGSLLQIPDDLISVGFADSTLVGSAFLWVCLEAQEIAVLSRGKDRKKLSIMFYKRLYYYNHFNKILYFCIRNDGFRNGGF